MRRGQVDIVHLLIGEFKERYGTEKVSDFVSRGPPKTGHPVLFIAIRGGSKEIVRILLDHGIRYKDNWYEASCLLATATFNTPQITQMFLEYSRQGKMNGKMLISAQGRNNRTALREACEFGHNEVARILLDYGADWSVPDDISNTALHKVIQQEGDASDMAAYLLEKAYSGSTAAQLAKFLNTKNKLGRTALMDAAARNEPLCFEVLLKYGADWSLADNVGVTALNLACWKGYESILALLAKVAQEADKSRFEMFLNHRNEQGKTALIDAVETNRPSLVKQLLKLGADYMISNKNKVTALHYGCYRGHESAIQLILDRASQHVDRAGFSEFLNARNNQGKTALMDASETDRPSLI